MPATAASDVSLRARTNDLPKYLQMSSLHTSIRNHPQDLILRARVLDLPVVIASVVAFEGLEKTGISNAVWRYTRLRTHTALSFLHYDGEDKSVVDSCLLRNLFDCRVQILDLLIGVVRGTVEVATASADCMLVGDP